MPNLDSLPNAVMFPGPYPIGPWGAISIAISQAQVALKLGTNDATTGTNKNTDIQMPYAGWIVGITFQLDTGPKTAGALQCSPTIGGTEVASTNALYRVAMANSGRIASKLCDAGLPGLGFVAGNVLGIKVTSDGSFAPSGTNDLHAYLWVVCANVQH